jgi:ABC-type phosphate transport system permease subunit
VSQARVPARRTRRRLSGVGLSFLFGAATCLAGSLASASVAAIIAGVLLALGVCSFALHRASQRLEEIIAPEPTQNADENARPPSAA